MTKKPFSKISCCVAGLLIAGCVGQGAYEKKIQEASTLSRETNLLKREKTEISRENDELRMELATSGRRVSELELSKKKLEDTLSSGTDRGSQRLIELERENTRLKAEIDSVLRGREENVRGVSRLYENLIERMKDDIACGNAKLAELRGRVTISVNGPALFEKGNDVLKPSGIVLLKKIAGILKELGARDFQISSSFIAYGSSEVSRTASGATWLLESGRVTAVTRFLGENGLDPSNIFTKVSGSIDLFEAGSRTVNDEIVRPIEIIATVRE